MKNLYKVSVLYSGDLPQENPHSVKMSFVVCGDILKSFNIEETSKINAMIKAKEYWLEPDPEFQIFQKSEEIMFVIAQQKWDKKDAV